MNRQIAKCEKSMARATGRHHHLGKFCPCCCQVGGDPQAERVIVARARRRLGKAIVAAELAEFAEPVRCVDCKQVLEPGEDNGLGQCPYCAADPEEP